MWQLAIGCGSAFSMQFFANYLYIVTTDGSFGCIDASISAIKSAQAGTVPQIVNIKAPYQVQAAVPSNTLETTSQTSNGVIVECFRQGTQLRIRVVSPRYDFSLNVQFPKEIRKEGTRYVVQEVHESSRGGFYRAYGDVKELR